MEGTAGGGVGEVARSTVRLRVERRVSEGDVGSARDDRFGVALPGALDFLAFGVVSGSGVVSPRFNLADRRGVNSTLSSSML